MLRAQHTPLALLDVSAPRTGLERLGWADNGITVFPPSTLSALQRLTYLDLSSNQLTTFEAAPGHMLCGMTPLETHATKALRERQELVDCNALVSIAYPELEDSERFSGACSFPCCSRVSLSLLAFLCTRLCAGCNIRCCTVRLAARCRTCAS